MNLFLPYNIPIRLRLLQLAEAVPQSMLDDCPWGGEMVKTKMYMKCMMKKKVKTCMRKDIKDKLEEHFGGVDKVQ